MQENKNFQQINAPALYLRSYLAPAKSGDFCVQLATVSWPLFEKLFEEGSGLRNLEEVLYYLFKASSRLKGRGSGSASEKPAQL